MRKWQLQALAWTFSAFLPKDDDDDDDADNNSSPEQDDYYALLGIKRNASPDDIRRAYKKKSLQLHPDKIAQRASAGDKTEEEIRRDFQRVKEAYETLSDPQKREMYDGLGPLGMKFINNPQSALDPHALLDNLAKSSFCDRTKLFVIVLVFVLLVLMQPILICSKIDQDLRGSGVLADSSWAAVLIPLWFLDLVFLTVFVAARVIGPTIKLLCTIVLEIFLALKWDGTVAWPYAIVLIPLYLLEVARLGSCLYWVHKANADTLRMVTMDMLEEDIIPRHYSGRRNSGEEEDGETGDEETGVGGGGATRLYADLTDEERDEINKIYIIVHVPPDVAEAAAISAQNGADEIDHDEQIAQSPEYQAALDVMFQSFRTMRNIVVVHVMTIVLLVLKADGVKNYSWWIVSIPLWVQIGFTMVSSCFRCCTAGADVSGGEELLAMQTGEGRKNGDGDDDGDDNDGANDGDGIDEPLAPPAGGSKNTAPVVVAPAAVESESPESVDHAEAYGDQPPPLEQMDGSLNEEGFVAEETKVSVDEESLKSMKISELKSELEAYGISTAQFVEKSEFVNALAKAQASGIPKGSRASSPPQNEPSSSSGDAGDTCDADDDSSGVYIDEETFKAWAHAQAAREEKASEIAAKACSRCCEQVFWAMMLALFVAKLAGEDVADDGASGAKSYSTFWILFPFLLVAGVFLCCCCCSIYCASNVEGLEENMRQSMMRPGGGGDGETPTAAAAAAAATEMGTEARSSGEAPLIPMPPPPAARPPTQSASAASAEEEKEEVTSEVPITDAQSEASDDLD